MFWCLFRLTRLHSKWDSVLFSRSLESPTNISAAPCPPVRVWIEFHNWGLEHLPQTNKGQLSPCLAAGFCGRFFCVLYLFFFSLSLSSEAIIIVHYDCGPLLVNCDDVSSSWWRPLPDGSSHWLDALGRIFTQAGRKIAFALCHAKRRMPINSCEMLMPFKSRAITKKENGIIIRGLPCHHWLPRDRMWSLFRLRFIILFF